ncbi:MAG TPA: bifunctional nuclease family protein [bacterium]|nr:bifunctional nuclease family protein [bacterium]
MFLEMKVAGIVLDPYTNVPIVVLKDMEEKTSVPIWIGLVEASAIAMELENIKIQRPLTHDLFKNVLAELKVEVVKIEVTDLRDNTYFALIYLDKGGEIMTVDSRPSDAIALALRTKSPIFVSDKVIEKSQKVDARDASFTEENKDKWTEILENLNPEDFGKYKM